jgi:hypothetical protein
MRLAGRAMLGVKILCQSLDACPTPMLLRCICAAVASDRRLFVDKSLQYDGSSLLCREWRLEGKEQTGKVSGKENGGKGLVIR